MDIGAMRDRVTIQAPSDAQDALGEPVDAWTDVATVWATVGDVSGREYLAADAAQNKAQTKIFIRYRPDVMATMRVVHGATVYNIEAVLRPSGRPIYLLLMCSRGVRE